MSAENLKKIQEILQKRGKEHVRIIAVTKTYGPEVITELLRAGQRDFGENRYNEARDKIPHVDLTGIPPENTPVYHHIGPLQSGMARQIPSLFTWVHGASSISGIEALYHAAEKKQENLEKSGQLEDALKRDLWPVRFLIQLNLTGEESKLGGMTFEEFLRILDHPLLRNTGYGKTDSASPAQWKGFMTMGPSDGDPGETAEVFHRLRDIRNEYCPGGELSMGMSSDFELALDFDTTMIRLGSILFGRRSR